MFPDGAQQPTRSRVYGRLCRRDHFNSCVWSPFWSDSCPPALWGSVRRCRVLEDSCGWRGASATRSTNDERPPPPFEKQCFGGDDSPQTLGQPWPSRPRLKRRELLRNGLPGLGGGAARRWTERLELEERERPRCCIRPRRRRLRWSDVDIEAQTITVRRSITKGRETTPKSGHQRVIPIGATFLGLLRVAPKPATPWSPVAPIEAGRIWGSALRHYFVSELFHRGAGAAAHYRA